MKANQTKQEIIDAREPRWLQRAVEKVDLRQRWKVINLRLEEHEDDIWSLLTHMRSKMKPQKPFEGVFHCGDIEF